MRYSLLVLLLAFIGAEPNASAQNADIRLLRQIHLSRNQNLDGFIVVVSESAIPTAISVPTSFLAAGFFQKDTNTFRQGLTMVGALALNTGITYGMKYAIGRQRPYDRYEDINPVLTSGSPAFPSGHTSTAFTTAMNLSLAIPKWYVAVPAFTWASAVGYARMHLGVHYPSDVLMGAVVGAGSAWLSHKANMWLQQRKTKH
jgi:undecaprenyl-diphosphatase